MRIDELKEIVDLAVEEHKLLSQVYDLYFHGKITFSKKDAETAGILVQLRSWANRTGEFERHDSYLRSTR